VSGRKVCIRTWWPLGVLLAVVAVSVGLACNGDDDTERTVVITLTSPTPMTIPTPTVTPTPTPAPTPTPLADVCGVNPDPAPASVLQVQEPQPLERVTNPFHMRGWGSEIGFENTGVAVALIDAKGDPIALDGTGSLSKNVAPESRAGRVAPPGLTVTDFTAPFATDMLVQGLSTDTPFCIWVFLETTEEGIPKQVLQVPIVVSP
jgi:hypothetical protein